LPGRARTILVAAANPPAALVRIDLVPAAQLPQPDQIGPWLERIWTQVDAWVADHTDRS
jgi:hypothetical protein